MNGNKTAPVSGRFPTLFLTAAMLLTVLVLGWFGWNTYRSYSVISMVRERHFRIRELQGQIMYLDEVLTMSAKMAAATGELAWEQRYLSFEPELDKAIKEVIQLAPNAYSGEGAAETDAANLELVDMEHRAFDLVRQRRQAEASAILASAEYAAQKQI